MHVVAFAFSFFVTWHEVSLIQSFVAAGALIVGFPDPGGSASGSYGLVVVRADFEASEDFSKVGLKMR